MALTTLVKYSFTVKDRFETKSTMLVLYYADAVVENLAQLAAAWYDLGDNLNHIIDGVIVGGGISVEYQPSTLWSAVAGENSFVERGANFVYAGEDFPDKYTIRVPSFDLQFVSNGKINTGNEEVLGFLEAIVEQGATLEPVTKYLHILSHPVASFMSVNKRRKQLDRSTLEPGE